MEKIHFLIEDADGKITRTVGMKPEIRKQLDRAAAFDEQANEESEYREFRRHFAAHDRWVATCEKKRKAKKSPK